MLVYVLAKNGNPLMPTTRLGKVRHLLKDGKAKVVRRCPWDSVVIATGGDPFIDLTDVVYRKKSVAKGDYKQRKGQHSEIVIPTGKIQGFRKYDKVLYFGKEYFIKGRMSSGYCVLMDIDGNKIDFSDKPKGFKTPKLSNLKRIGARKSCIITTEVDNLNIA